MFAEVVLLFPFVTVTDDNPVSVTSCPVQKPCGVDVTNSAMIH